MADEQRHIPNHLPDYDAFIASLHHHHQQQQTSQTVTASEGLKKETALQLAKTTPFMTSAECVRLKEAVRSWILQNIQRVRKACSPSSSRVPVSMRGYYEQEVSIYIGTGGNAYLHWRLSKFFEEEGDKERKLQHQGDAVTAINVALSLLPARPRKGEGVAFYIGNTGIHALAAVIFSSAGDHSQSSKQISLLLNYIQTALESSADEILYGRAGYLFSLLFVKNHVPSSLLEGIGMELATRKVFDAILKSGNELLGSTQSILRYSFYGTDYHGAAHGTAGILFILLQFPDWCSEPSVKSLIQNTLDYMLSLQLPSGNFPLQTKRNDEDVQIHWCHGAPGFVYTLYHAYKVFGDEKYKVALDQALDVIWHRGVLKKGLGLCHGIAGNAYAFLVMYRYTGEERELYRAFKMAELMQNDSVLEAIASTSDPQRQCQGLPDFPYSLMEGLAGTICFHCDLLHPQKAAFPGYDGDL